MLLGIGYFQAFGDLNYHRSFFDTQLAELHDWQLVLRSLTLQKSQKLKLWFDKVTFLSKKGNIIK